MDHARLGRAHPAGTVVVLAAQRGRQLEPMRSGARRIGADQRKEQFRVGETAGLVTLDRGSRQLVGPDEVVVPIAGATGEQRVTYARREQGSTGAELVCQGFVAERRKSDGTGK